MTTQTREEYIAHPDTRFDNDGRFDTEHMLLSDFDPVDRNSEELWEQNARLRSELRRSRRHVTNQRRELKRLNKANEHERLQVLRYASEVRAVRAEYRNQIQGLTDTLRSTESLLEKQQKSGLRRFFGF